MKIDFFLGLFFISSISYCQTITYDFSCMETDEGSTLINIGSDFEKEFISTYGETITLEEEIIAGNKLLEVLGEEFKIISSGSNVNYLSGILKKMVLNIPDPKGYPYKIFILESKELNAFTCGGNIFFTSSFLTFCRNNDEVASIIGHEIAHNELGHINYNLSKIKTAETFGDFSVLASVIIETLTTPFNQKNETHCDFYGIDLMIASNYKPCAASTLWKRMLKLDSEYNTFTNFLSTHPYSGKRVNCCKSHILNNYSLNCSD